MKSLQHITGRIIAVQEDRFRMVDDAGRGLLLTLSASANAGPSELQQWQAEARRVSVSYRGEANLGSGIARRVHPEKF